MRCETIREQLDAYRTGELLPDEQAALVEHLAVCPQCTAALDELGRLAEQMRALAARVPSDLVATVLVGTSDTCGRIETVLGPTWVAFSPQGITMIWVGEQSLADFEAVYRRRLGRSVRQGVVPERYTAAVRAAAAGEPWQDVRFDLAALTPFERQVLLLLPRIPRGEVRPYAWLAREVGRPRAVRAVGSAMARNPVPLLLPCHRVVPTTGGVGNYAFGSEVKRQLLMREGMPIEAMDELARRGVRYLGCASTHIYCFPTCRNIRRARPENHVAFHSEREAAAAGYRPCQHCRPAVLAS